MHRLPLRFMLSMLLGVAPSAFAGVHNPAEPDEGRLDPVPDKFRATLIALQSIAAPKVTVETPLRKRYLFQESIYDKAIDKSRLSAEQKLVFSAVLLRRGRPQDAILLLRDAGRQHPDMFLLQANLATAYHMSGDKLNARTTMKDCIDAWPKDFRELSDKQQALFASLGWAPTPERPRGAYAAYREADASYLKLLQLRSREPKQADAQFQDVDALFDVKFVAESGKFEPGQISKAEQAKLPGNALEIVQQLLVWLPHDLRLRWLLAEVLNAEGRTVNVLAARSILDELVWSYNVRAPELMARRQALNEWTPPPETSPDDPDKLDKKDPPPAALDWRGLGVAFAAGMLVAVFGMWQVREIRRRRQRT